MRSLLVKMGLMMMGSGALKWLLETYILPKIDKFVASTENEYDDAAAKYLKEMLKELAVMAEKKLL